MVYIQYMDPQPKLILPPISPAASKPLYEQIIDGIKREISAGRLPSNSALPSFRALAEDLLVSVITVKRAYEELEHEGISEEEFVAFGAGTLRSAMVDGDVERGTVMAGQSAGLVYDVVPVKELVERIIAEAEGIIRRSAALVVPEE